jgi:hypothetical protein
MMPWGLTFGYENIRAEGDSRMHMGNVINNNNNTTNHSKASDVCRSYAHAHNKLIPWAR